MKRGNKKIGYFVIIGIVAAFIIAANLSDTENANNSEVSSEIPPEDLKTQALEFDERAWDGYIKLYETHNNFMDTMDAYSDGKISKLDFYDYCKDLEKWFGQASMSFNYGKTDDEKTYLDTFQTFALADQSAVDSLLKYLDSNVIKDLSKAKENINRAQEAATIIASNRVVLLKKIGLTKEEIAEKINQATADIEASDKK